MTVLYDTPGDAGGGCHVHAFPDQPFTSSEMGDSMDADLLPELSLGGGHVVGGTYRRFATGWIKSGPYCGISAGCNFDNCA